MFENYIPQIKTKTCFEACELYQKQFKENKPSYIS
jgi:hypothetical protein